MTKFISRMAATVTLGLGIGLVSFSAQAALINITFMSVESAHVDADFLPVGGINLNVVTNDNLVADYIPAITSTNIGGGIQTTYTGMFNQDPNNMGPSAGTLLGSVVPYGFYDDTAGTIMVNMSSFFSDHFMMDQNLGAIAMGTWDSVTGDYSMSWSAVLTQGMNAGEVVTFTFEGSTVAVPVPAAIWLMISGLGLLAIRKKK